MSLEDLASLSGRGRLQAAAVALALIVACVWASLHFLKPAPPRHIVLASGLTDGLYHQFAKRYAEILARSGITIDERLTDGAGENLPLLEDPNSGVDIGFTQGGVARFPTPTRLSCSRASITSLCGSFTVRLIRSNISISFAITGSRSAARGAALVRLQNAVFALNDLTNSNVTLVPLNYGAALRSLQAAEIDAAIMVDGPDSEAIKTALRDPNLKSLASAMLMHTIDGFPTSSN